MLKRQNKREKALFKRTDIRRQTEQLSHSNMSQPAIIPLSTDHSATPASFQFPHL
jgi:hypothetical protein